jgi:hypothetical protein
MEEKDMFDRMYEIEKKINEIEKFLSLNVRYYKSYADLVIDGRNLKKKEE